jgi:hypothetical protein
MSTWGRTARWAGAAAAVLAIGGCGVVTPAVGSGPTESADRPIAGVTAVELDTSGTVEVTTGAAQALTIEAPSDVLPVLTSDVVGGTLRLSVKDRAVLRNADRIRYRLTVPTLERIAVDGSGDVRYADLEGPRLTAEIDGSGEISVAGTVDEQEVTLSGSGSYTAVDLATRRADVRLDGSGDVAVRVSDALAIDIKGSGEVSYRGSPSLQKNIAGSGDVTQVP